MKEYFKISSELAKKLDERLKYNVVVECPELANYFQLQNVEITDKFVVGCRDIYVVNNQLFLGDGDFAYPITKEPIDQVLVAETDQPIKLWKSRTDDIWISEIYYSYVYIFKRGELRFGNRVYYFSLVKDKYYTSYEVMDRYNDDKEKMRADLFKKYLRRKREAIMRRLSRKYDFSFREYIKLEDTWRAFRIKYKKVMAKLRNNIERGIASTQLSEMGLRNAGWLHYNICKPIEPSESVIQGDFAITLIRFNYGEILIKANGNYVTKLQIDRLPDKIKDLAGSRTIKINDGRIVKYLKFNPGFLKVNFTKIPYFKWALNRVFEEII